MISITDLEEFKSSWREESRQFTGAMMALSGALTLGVERFFTDGLKDPLFLFCLVCAVAATVIGHYGNCQLQRRKDKIDKIIARSYQQETEMMVKWWGGKSDAQPMNYHSYGDW